MRISDWSPDVCSSDRPQESPVPKQQEAQDFVPEPSPVEQEQVDRNAIAAEQREREQEEKRRQEQIDLTERKKQEEAERKFRLAEQQRDEKLKKIQAEPAKAEREAKLAEQKPKQIADLKAKQATEDAAPSAPPPPGNAGVDPGMRAPSAAAIQAPMLPNRTRPAQIP